ncbi:MAG: winged helix-turn-helix domain-containing protein [Thermoprotei archaeon]
MRTKRDRMDIMREILENVNKGRNTKSALMKYVGLSTVTLTVYLNYLRERGLIRDEEKGYVLTEKGKKVLDLLKEASSLESRLIFIMGELAKELEET